MYPWILTTSGKEHHQVLHFVLTHKATFFLTAISHLNDISTKPHPLP